MRGLVVVAIWSMLGWSGWAQSPSTQPAEVSVAEDSDRSAVALARKMAEALGGWEVWQRLRYLEFTFAVVDGGKVVTERRHVWDRASGRHRVEGEREGGGSFSVYTDLRRNKGRAYRDGELLKGEEAEKYLENAYALWINDTYWLAAPFKVFDPGVRLSKAEDTVVDGVEHRTFRVDFAGVGLTPRDVYWFWLDEEFRVKGWSFVLGGADAVPTRVRWTDWIRAGGLWFSGARVVEGSGREIRLSSIRVPEELPADWFEGGPR